MKANKIHFAKLESLSLILFIAILMQSCTVDIPETDTIPPQFSFRITGDGFDQTFDHNTDFDAFQLNLREDAQYDFILTGSDAGGVKEIKWQYPHDNTEFVDPISSPWEVSRASGLISVISWQGDSSNPITGNILSGKFRPNGELVGFSFDFSVKDFGGQVGTTNTFYASLNIYSGNHDSAIINF